MLFDDCGGEDEGGDNDEYASESDGIVRPEADRSVFWASLKGSSGGESVIVVVFAARLREVGFGRGGTAGKMGKGQEGILFPKTSVASHTVVTVSFRVRELS